MGPDSRYGRLLRGSLVALFAGLVLVTFCYFFVDRPVAFYVHDARLNELPVLKQLTYPPPVLQDLVPVVLVLLMIRRVRGPFYRWEQTLFAAGVALVLADQFRQTLGIACGRYWPETWINNNPSLIGDGAYGFHPFEKGSSSFPSGHTARMAAASAVAWVAYPRWRWLPVIVPLPIVSALVAMDYHFVGDVIGGGFIGGIVGVYTAHLCGLGGKAEVD